MASDGPRLSSAMTYINASERMGGFANSFVAGAGGLVMAAFAILIGIGESFAFLITNPVDAFAVVTALLIDAGFGAPARFLQDVWNTAAVTVGMDPWLQLGPFIVIVAALVVVGFLMIMGWYVDRIDADTLTGINYPIIRRDTGGDMADEND